MLSYIPLRTCIVVLLCVHATWPYPHAICPYTQEDPLYDSVIIGGMYGAAIGLYAWRAWHAHAGNTKKATQTAQAALSHARAYTSKYQQPRGSQAIAPPPSQAKPDSDVSTSRLEREISNAQASLRTAYAQICHITSEVVVDMENIDPVRAQQLENLRQQLNTEIGKVLDAQGTQDKIPSRVAWVMDQLHTCMHDIRTNICMSNNEDGIKLAAENRYLTFCRYATQSKASMQRYNVAVHSMRTISALYTRTLQLEGENRALRDCVNEQQSAIAQHVDESAAVNRFVTTADDAIETVESSHTTLYTASWVSGTMCISGVLAACGAYALLALS